MVAPSRNGIKSDPWPRRGGRDGPGSYRPRAALRLSMARGSRAARRSSGGAVAIRRASPETLHLGHRDVPREVRQRRGRRDPDTVRAAAAGRRRVARRPDDRLRSVVGISLGRERAADDPAVAGRPDHEVPVVRARDQVDGEARVRRGEERVDAGGLRVAAGDRERQVRARHAVEQPRAWRSRNRARSSGSVPIRVAAGSWTSTSGQPASARSRMTRLRASRRSRRWRRASTARGGPP